MVSLSICIVNWNTKDLLINCLNSIYSGTRETSFEIIVVDNASTDGTASILRKKFPDVILIENKQNLGFATANNQAMRVSRGEYILLLNSDTIVLGDSLEKMLDFMRKERSAGACGPKLLGQNGTWQQSFWAFPSFYSQLVDQFRFNAPPFSRILPQHPKKMDKYGNNCENHLTNVDVISGACIMVRRDVMEEVGLMEDGFFLYFEEDDWCFRMERRGHLRFYVPTSAIIHLEGESRKKLNSYLDDLSLHTSGVKYFRKHKGNIYASLVKQMYASFYCWRLIWSIITIIAKLVMGKLDNLPMIGFSACLNSLKHLYRV